jgi:hypothetical protein
MSDNPYKNMKNLVYGQVHTSKLYTWSLRARGLSDCVKGSWRD